LNRLGRVRFVAAPTREYSGLAPSSPSLRRGGPGWRAIGAGPQGSPAGA